MEMRETGIFMRQRDVGSKETQKTGR
jgi:hypothetical protein